MNIWKIVVDSWLEKINDVEEDVRKGLVYAKVVVKVLLGLFWRQLLNE